MIKMTKKGECNRLKNYDRIIKSPFMIYTNFESTVVPEGNGKQIPEKSYTNKYQEHVACSYGYKLYLLMIGLVSLLSHTQVKMPFTILLIVFLNETSFVLK